MLMHDILVVDRGVLYYNKYKYKAKCQIPAAGYTRNAKTMDDFILVIDRVKRYINTTAINDDVKESIAKLIIFNNSGLDVRLRIEYGTVLFFFNHLEYIKYIEDISPIISIHEVKLHPSDELYLKNPIHKYRTYIRPNQTYPWIQPLRSFSEYADTNKDIKISKSIEKVLSSKKLRLIYHFSGGFVDYNDESLLSILHIYLGSMVKKTVKLCKA